MVAFSIVVHDKWKKFHQEEKARQEKREVFSKVVYILGKRGMDDLKSWLLTINVLRPFAMSGEVDTESLNLAPLFGQPNMGEPTNNQDINPAELGRVLASLLHNDVITFPSAVREILKYYPSVEDQDVILEGVKARHPKVENLLKSALDEAIEERKHQEQISEENSVLAQAISHFVTSEVPQEGGEF